MASVEDFVEFGYVSKAHGIRGEIKLSAPEFSSHKIPEFGTLYLEFPGAVTEFKVTASRAVEEHQFLIKFKTVNTRNEAESLVGKKVYLAKSDLQTVAVTGFLFSEVQGYEVVDNRKGILGTVKRVIKMPGQDLIEVLSGTKIILIPITEEFVPLVNRSQRLIHTNLPDGLLEVYLD